MKDNQPTTAKGEDEIHLLKEIYTMLVCTYMSRVCEHLYTHVTCVHTCPPALMGGNPMMNVGEHSGCRPRPGKNELLTTTEKKHAVSLGWTLEYLQKGCIFHRTDTYHMLAVMSWMLKKPTPLLWSVPNVVPVCVYRMSKLYPIWLADSHSTNDCIQSGWRTAMTKCTVDIWQHVYIYHTATTSDNHNINHNAPTTQHQLHSTNYTAPLAHHALHCINCTHNARYIKI